MIRHATKREVAARIYLAFGLPHSQRYRVFTGCVGGLNPGLHCDRARVGHAIVRALRELVAAHPELLPIIDEE